MAEQVRAAGGVLWRSGADGPELALVHRPRYDDWSFPKGKAKPAEDVLCTAVREIFEETGIQPVLGRRLASQNYPTEAGPKHVDYWAATGAPADLVPNDEVDRLEWLSVAASRRRLSYARDGELLEELVAGPWSTTPYVILRHTSAGDKHEWREDDLLRPLDTHGREQAGWLADLLASFGPARVVSSATARCLETVLPLVARTGGSVSTDEAFTVGSSKAAGDRLAGLLAEDLPTIVCTHGELVPDLIERACDELGGSAPEDPGLRKGGFWVLQVADGELASIERHDLSSDAPGGH
jgi:8-oxo-(d)GTP phosphatase